MAGRRPFVVTPYVAREDGSFVARTPDAGPCTGQDDRACVVGIHHLRRRKTGPCHPLTVMMCATHGLGFTLYPHGHVPYGRLAVAPVVPDGEAVCGPWRGAEAFAGTLFEAALGASVGVAWPREAAAEALGVPLLMLREGARAIVEAPGYRSRGRAVRDVLERLEAAPCVLWRLLAGGRVAGVWGAAHEWDARTGRLRPGRFQRTRTAPG